MKAKAIIAMITTKVKSILQERAEQLEASLTVENAEKVVDVIQEAVFSGAAEGLKTWLQESETQKNTVVHDGQNYQFNRISTKEFQSSFGKVTLERRLYQNKNGESFIPLDHAWNMEHQFATLEVREAVLFALGHMPARDARQLFADARRSILRNLRSKRLRNISAPASKSISMNFWKRCVKAKSFRKRKRKSWP